MAIRKMFKGNKLGVIVGFVSVIVLVLFLAVAGLNLTAIPDRLVERWIASLEDDTWIIRFDDASFTGLTRLNVHGLSIEFGQERDVGVDLAEVTIGLRPLDLLFGKIAEGPMNVSVKEGDVSWGQGDRLSEVTFESAAMRIIRDETGWHVHDATASAYGGTITGYGYVGGDRGYDLYVTASDVQLPENLPVFKGSGIAGKADFDGVLSGQLTTPTLKGQMTLEHGAVWHRPVDIGHGDIELMKGRFAFNQTRLLHEHARYDLIGEVLTGGEQTILDIEIAADHGRIEQLLAAFGLASDVSGDIDGAIDISGPTGSLNVTGKLTGEMINVAQAFLLDRAEGSFAWSDGQLKLGDLNVALDGGEVTLAGDFSTEQMNVTVAAVDWPIDQRMDALLPVPPGVGGRLGFTGHISGSITEPYITGHMMGGHLEVGRLTLNDPQGMVAVAPGQLTATGLTVNSVGDGTYVVDGTVTNWLQDDPTLDLSIDVKGASLGAILAENGLGWPALLVDGLVSGRISMEGDPSKPNAQFDFALGDEEDDETFALTFSLDEGRIQLGNLPVLIGRDGLSIGGLLQSVESIQAMLS